MDFGSKVRELRLTKRLTQRELADRLGIDFSYISKIENGKVDHPPSEELIRRMATTLEADAEELLDLAGKFDQDTLRKVVDETPKVGALLRRLQSRRLSDDEIQQIMTILNKDQPDD
jgi:HTH-type transcriptional regulator, competence development regulator